MTPIRRLFFDLRYEIVKIVGFSAFLDAAILYLVLAIVLALLSRPWWLALGGAAVFFAVIVSLRARRLTLAVIERKNPAVHEMLRTARDNINAQTIMAQALFADVVRRANAILVGNLVSYRALLGKVVLIAGLSVLMVTLSAVNIKISGFRNPFEGLGGSPLVQEVPLLPVQLADAIYGDARVAPLGDERLDLMLSAGLSELDPTKLMEERELALNPNAYPGEVKAVGAEASSEEVPKDAELAATYNEKLQQLG